MQTRGIYCGFGGTGTSIDIRLVNLSGGPSVVVAAGSDLESWTLEASSPHHLQITANTSSFSTIVLVTGRDLDRVQLDGSVPHHLRLIVPLNSDITTYALDIPGVALDYVASDGSPMPPPPPP